MTVRSSHNFIIGDLGFHKLLDNEEHAYERATAPFRKEQFDSSPTVGDQSLTGWWTRGQLSFHKGAGVKYYEVLDGEEVLNRYDSSLGVDTLGTPGATVLHGAMVDGTTSTIPNNLTWAEGYQEVAVPNGLLYLADGALYKGTVGGAASALATIDETSVRDACVAWDEWTAYGATTGRKVERLLASATLARASLYTHTDDIDAIFYEKRRLWVMDSKGNLYALASVPSGTLPKAIASSDLVASLPGSSQFRCSLTASTGAVYVSGGDSTVYAVTVDTGSGDVVPATTAVVAASLPQGETVTFLKAHLGYVVIGTTLGVRVAVIDSGGGLVYGPLHQTGQCGRRATIRGTAVWFVASDAGLAVGPNYLTEIDLAQPIEGGGGVVFAWTRKETFGGGSYVGAFGARDGVGFYRGTGPQPGGQIKLAGTGLRSSGELTTGFHRFGTLEGKHFAGVKVRAGGTGGTITTYLLDQSGGETQLMTIDLATETGGEVSLVNNPPMEAVALKFVLSRDSLDSANGPTLLGYQIKALPSPKRQRLIRVPLMMFDVERGPTGRSVGREKEAWTRLEALESLEENDALVTFEDKGTGETGTVYIESVEMSRKNGSKGQSKSNGFGGVVTVTLRKVD